MNDEIKEALRQFNREDLIDEGYERDLDSNIEVFLTTKQMIYYKQLQSNWNSLREIIKDLGIDYLLDKMNELEGKDKE